MTARYHGDCCPACGSDQVIPYAVIVGAAEEYGYHCPACEIMWPVLTYPARETADPAARTGSPAA
jgi:transposase-like protein